MSNPYGNTKNWRCPDCRTHYYFERAQPTKRKGYVPSCGKCRKELVPTTANYARKNGLKREMIWDRNRLN